MPGETIELQPLIGACLADAPQSEKIRTIRSLLTAETRSALGNWIAGALSLETLIPEVYSAWRPLIRDAFAFVFAHLSEERLAGKLVEQAGLPLDTPPAARLLALISKMPGIQKVGQVVARHRELGENLCRALSELENGMSDMSAEDVWKLAVEQLGTRMREYAVKLDSKILSEASVSAVLRFSWRNPETKTRERGVLKVRKPHVPAYFAEDLALLQQLGEFVASSHGYGFASQHVAEMVAEVRMLLEHELDFEREQAMLRDAFETYKLTLGIRVPRLIAPLCTSAITAMSEEAGVKVTEAFPAKVYRRRQVADQLIEALVAVPLLSREENAFFHADPHAGNLLYDEYRHEVVILDWALTERLSRDLRRHLTLLVIMTVLRNTGGVAEAIQNLAAVREPATPQQIPLIRRHVKELFKELPDGRPPGALDAMRLLDRIALDGVRFPAALAMFQKAMFTLDGVLYDVAGSKVSISAVLVRDFMVRLMASFGLNHPPLSASDLIRVPRGVLAAALRSSSRDTRSDSTTEESKIS